MADTPDWSKAVPRKTEKFTPESGLPSHVMQAFVNAGFSSSGARVLAAEVGRENGFQEKWVYGSHSDPKNQAKNTGFFSWQGDRAQALDKYLAAAGVLKDGVIAKGQASLDAMAKFTMSEMASGKHGGGQKLVQMLQQPTVDYQEAAQAVGTQYIKWRYNDPKFASGHTNRDRYYKQLGGVVTAPPTNSGPDWSKAVARVMTPDWSGAVARKATTDSGGGR